MGKLYHQLDVPLGEALFFGQFIAKLAQAAESRRRPTLHVVAASRSVPQYPSTNEPVRCLRPGPPAFGLVEYGP